MGKLNLDLNTPREKAQCNLAASNHSLVDYPFAIYTK